MGRALTLKETNWLGEEPTILDAARSGRRVLARVRSTRPGSPASLDVVDGRIAVLFDAPEEAIAPGQACVLYDALDPDRLLGGGFIDRAPVAADLQPALESSAP